MNKPFSYPGRDSVHLSTYLNDLAPELKSMYAFDMLLSGGEILFLTKGGVGYARENYIAEMHRFLKRKTSVDIIKTTWAEEFNSTMSRTAFRRLTSWFNTSNNLLYSNQECARLFLLWASTSYTHRYLRRKYFGSYAPKALNFEHIAECSALARQKALFFKKAPGTGLEEFLLGPQTFLYAHLPNSNSASYTGSGFKWDRKRQEDLVAKLSKLSKAGLRVLVSAKISSRGAELSRTRALDYLLDAAGLNTKVSFGDEGFWSNRQIDNSKLVLQSKG